MQLGVEALESRVLLSGYTVEDLGTLGGNSSQANAINASGQVVGLAQLANGAVHAVLWNPGQPGKDLGTLGGANSTALAINTLGEIVGRADTATDADQPFDLLPGKSMTDLTNAANPQNTGATILTARGVSDAGVIVGQGSFNAIDLTLLGPFAFDPPSGTVNGLDGSLNIGEAIAVAGTRAVANLVDNNLSQAVVEDINTPDSSVPLPAIMNQTQSEVLGLSAADGLGTQFATGFAIDSSGAVHSVLWIIPAFAPLVMTVLDLGHVAGATDQGSDRSARAVNSLGDVVGDDTVGGASVAFVKAHDGTITRLDSLLPAGSGITLEHATGINDAGQICAIGLINGKEHAFRLTLVTAAPPGATLTFAPDVTAFGATSYFFQVTYTDSVGIDSTSVTGAALVEKGGLPAGFAPRVVSITGTPQHLVVTYSFAPPGGSWDFTDDGTYTVNLRPNFVRTTTGQGLDGGLLGHFVAAVPAVRGAIIGTVFNDANANGKRDAGETGLANASVYLDLNRNSVLDAGDRIVQTDANGLFTFGGLLPGNYLVHELIDRPHASTFPQQNTWNLDVQAGVTVVGINFGDVADPQIIQLLGQNLAVAHGITPQFDQPGTLLHIIGQNFPAGSVFFFGNDQAEADPINLVPSSGVESLGLRVPRYATTGPLVVHTPNGRDTVLIPNFTVDSYRNTNGYAFVNNGQGYSKFSFDDLTAVFGKDQTHISIDACGALSFGLVNCTVNTGIPDPLAYLELAIINKALPPNKGQCLGMVLSAARLSLGMGQLTTRDFPSRGSSDNPTVWDLSNPAGPSPDLRQFIKLAHLEQTSEEFLENYVQQVAINEVNGVGHLISNVRSELAHGRPVLVPFMEGGFGGHCVLAYNVEDLPNGGEQLDVYDPNTPFLDSERPDPINGHVLQDGSEHKARVDGSTITFRSDGHWVYNSPDGTHASGGLASIATAPLSIFNSHTLTSSDIEGLVSKFMIFGSATETQVTDSAGHTLLNADGSPNTNPQTRIPNAARYIAEQGAAPIDLVGGNGSFMQTIVGTGTGTYGAASLGKDAMAMISGVSSVRGQADRFGLNPANDMLTFIPGSNKQVTADLVINAPAGVQREAQLTSDATGGMMQTLQFMGSQRDHVVLHNTGGAGNFTLNLTSNADGLVQTFTTGRMAVGAGDTVDLLPSTWADIQTAKATVVVHHANGTSNTFTLSNGGKGEVLNAKEGVSFSGAVAQFTNLSPTGVSAVIDWGDGTTSAGHVAGAGTGVIVSGAHTYATQGYYPTRISLTDARGALGQATGEAVVADTKFTLAGAQIPAFAGVPFSGTVATLTDLPSGDQAGDFNVTISWGDGTSSTGTLQTTAAGKFDVHGSHTWATAGNKSVVITVTERGSAAGQGHTIKIAANRTFTGTVAQLQLPIPGSAASDYVATIDWGDHKTSRGTLTLQADGTVLLAGSHTYATGNKSFVTHFTLSGGPRARATSTAVVSPAVGTVTGTLFNDVNGNGKQDAGEAGLAGRTVFVDRNRNGRLDPGEPRTLTNASGVYTLTNVPAGTIRVKEFIPAGFRIDAPAAGFIDATLPPGGTLTGQDFANTQLALISGTVFLDGNGNRKRDRSEAGLAHRTVFLDLNKDGVRQANEPTALTDTTGAFAFTTVTPGTYVVRLVPEFGFRITTPFGGGYGVTVGNGATSRVGLFGEKPVALAFASPASLTTTGGKPVALVVADFNGDHRPDIATADSAGNDVTVFLNKGGGTFAAGKKFAVGKTPVGIVAGDFNGDGKTDLAVADLNNNAVHLLLGAGNGTFQLSKVALVAAAPNGIAAFDFNGDHRTDLVVSDRNSRQVTVFLSRSAGGFAAGKTIGVEGLPGAITVADVNGDRRPDLLVANGAGNGRTDHGSVSVLLGDGKGGFALQGSTPTLTGPASIAVGDFDGDGRVDVLTANPGSASAAILFGDGQGGFGPPTRLAPGGTPMAVVAGDFNGDGLTDAAFAEGGSGGNRIAVLAGRGDGSFAAGLNLPAGTSLQEVVAADLNADGKLDLVAVSRDGNQVVILRNKTT